MKIIDCLKFSRKSAPFFFEIRNKSNPNRQKMKFPTRLFPKKLIGMPVQIFERLDRERTGQRLHSSGTADASRKKRPVFGDGKKCNNCRKEGACACLSEISVKQALNRVIKMTPFEKHAVAQK